MSEKNEQVKKKNCEKKTLKGTERGRGEREKE